MTVGLTCKMKMKTKCEEENDFQNSWLILDFLAWDIRYNQCMLIISDRRTVKIYTNREWICTVGTYVFSIFLCVLCRENEFK